MTARPRFTSEQLTRIDRVSAEAMQLASDQRQAHVELHCSDDPVVCAEILALVNDVDASEGFLEQPAQLPDAVTVDAAFGADTDHMELPARIGRYRILSKLGEGGMGAVYAAEQDQPKRTVAIKVIRHGLATSEVKRRFTQEATVLARLRHVGIGHIYDVGEAEVALADGQVVGNRPYFAMELIRGRPIDRFVHEEGSTAEDILRLVAHICDAVHHAHGMGVVHRDLKPGNIIVDDGGQPRILDFGVARVTDSDLQITTIQTNIGQLIGTVAYMSPEQVGGVSRHVDARSDVYALGVILYRLLSGQLPYDLRDRMITEAARTIQEDEPTRLGALRTQLRGDIETIVSKAMDKDKERRYQSAADLAMDLRRHLNHEPIVARQASTFYQFRKFARRNRGLVIGAGLGMVALLTGSGVAVWQAVEARRSQHEAEARFDDVRDLARTFIFDFHDKLTPLAGSLEARKFLVETALTYANRLAEVRTNDPTLVNDVIKAYLRIGQMQGRPHNANIGDLDGALASYSRALELARKAAATWPDNLNHQHNVGLAHEALSAVFEGQGRYAEAETHCIEYITIIERLAEGDAGDMGRTREPGLARFRLGRLYEVQGRFADALREYTESHRIRQALADAHPDHTGFQLDCAGSCSKLGDMHRRAGELQQALERFRQAHAVRAPIAAAHPDNAEIQRALSLTHGRIGQALMTLGHNEEARSSFEQYLAIRRRLAEANPSDMRAQRDLAVALFRMGELDHETGRAAESVARYSAFVDIIKTLLMKTPGSVRLQSNLAAGRVHVGRSLLNAGRPDEAEPHLVDGLGMANAVIATTPDHAEAWGVRMLAELELGRLMIVGQHPADAVIMLNKVLEDVERRSDSRDANIELDHYKGDALRRLGDAHAALADHGESRARSCAYYASARACFGDLDARGALLSTHADVIAELDRELAGCGDAAQVQPDVGDPGP